MNVGEPWEKIRAFIAETNWTGRIIFDWDGNLAKKFLIVGYPTTVLMTSQCQLIVFTENEVFTWFFLGGRKWDDPRMIEFFKKAAADMKPRSS